MRARLALAVAVVALVLPSSPGHAAVAEPAATPKAVCGPGSHPETGLQGRVPPADRLSGRAAKGYSCNATLIGSYGSAGGFKVLRYVDKAGHECAYFDVSNSGVRVLDMSHPSKPVLTATLTTLAMFSPHESLALNQKRGLLVAVLGNALTAPGVVDVYDVTKDCRHPVLQSSSAVGLLGHESGFTPDGMTYYATAAISGTMAAVDLHDPKNPYMVWIGTYYTHGLTLSDDGKTAYTAGFPPGVLVPPGGLRDVAGPPGLNILDVSEVQERKVLPQVTTISKLTWQPSSLPQNAIPIRIKGHPYVFEFDEFSDLMVHTTGAARLIDIADVKHPKVVSNVRLQVNEAKNRTLISKDPGANALLGGYAAHYCAVPQQTDPVLVGCSFILSGMRIFNIADPLHPREVAYDNPPQVGQTASSTVSAPVIIPSRREVWYTDGVAGFRVLRLSPSAFAAAVATTPVRKPAATARTASRGALAATGLTLSVPFGGLVLAAAGGLWMDRRRRT